MKIIIVGAGEVGYNIAARLASESKHVTVIDLDPEACRRISEDIDVQIITGSGSNPEILIEAGITEAEILLAVTDSDEINLVACMMTDMISPSTKKLVRLRNQSFNLYHDRFKMECPHIDTVINPETEVVNTIHKLVDVPGAFDVGNFVDGKVKYVGIRIGENSPIADTALQDFPSIFKDNRPVIAVIIRNEDVIVPRGNDTINIGDLVYFVCESDRLEATLNLLGEKIQFVRSALIIGGGKIGLLLALKFEADGIKTKIIESNINRCNHLSEILQKTVVLHGDGSDQKLFLEENARQSDVVVSVTSDDETNILVSLLAKNLGISNTITRIGKSSYFPLLSTIGIEKIVSPRVSAVSSILQDVRKGKVLSDISIFDERGEFIEAIALETSDITDTPLKKVSFPKGAILVCIVRDDKIIIPTGESIVRPGDRIIMFAVMHAVKKLEKLLTVKLGFF